MPTESLRWAYGGNFFTYFVCNTEFSERTYTWRKVEMALIQSTIPLWQGWWNNKLSLNYRICNILPKSFGFGILILVALRISFWIRSITLFRKGKKGLSSHNIIMFSAKRVLLKWNYILEKFLLDSSILRASSLQFPYYFRFPRTADNVQEEKSDIRVHFVIESIECFTGAYTIRYGWMKQLGGRLLEEDLPMLVSSNSYILCLFNSISLHTSMSCYCISFIRVDNLQTSAIYNSLYPTTKGSILRSLAFCFLHG